MKLQWLLIPALCLTMAVPAFAQDVSKASAQTPLPESGWAYADWDMDAREVIAASDGKATAADANNSRHKVWNYGNGADGSTVINGVPYTVKYYFDPKTGKLTFLKINGDAKAECAALATYYQTTVKGSPQIIRELEDIAETENDDYWTARIGGNKYAHFAVSLTDMDICFIVVADADAKIVRK